MLRWTTPFLVAIFAIGTAAAEGPAATKPADGPAATNLPSYHATDIHLLRVTPVSPPGQPDAIQFFKVQSQ